jgi:phage/plasmid-like protein (TIGR03299 family)
MSHEIENMVYVGNEPWHGLGTKVPEEKRLSINDAIIAAGLNWEVGLRHIFTVDDRNKRVGILDHYATYRKTDNAVLGFVGANYCPLQNIEAFNWFQPFLNAKVATIETAGSLRGGKRIWILARVESGPKAIKGNDEVRNYILLSNSHDGSLAVRVGFTPIRVVCNNTLCMAYQSEASNLIRVRHTSRILENLDGIKEIMDLANKEFVATVTQYRALAQKEINAKDLEKYIRVVFDLKEHSESKKVIPTIVDLFESGIGNDLAGKTYWGAYNAANEYLNYFRGNSQDNILNNLWFGDSAQINKKALTVALEMAGVG